MSEVHTQGIAVILPVYRDIRVTRACIESCLPDIIAQGGLLILINDASPEHGMQAMLQEWASQYPQTIRLLLNKENLGFVATVNRGLRELVNNDVVLLNSDVLTPKRWLETLRREAARDHRIGTVTPLSNNSTITSLPNNNASSSQLLSLNINSINDSFDSELPLVKAPTGIGFCMLITAKCLSAVGLLDVENFSKGYGEESDFCQRAIKAGFVNVLTPNLYCHHVGAVSFGDSNAARLQDAYNKIAGLHPSYHADVAAWIHVDPLYSARVVRTLQIFKNQRLPFILHISHGIGGGPLRHISSLVSATHIEAVHIILNGRRRKQDPLAITISTPSSSEPIEWHTTFDAEALLLLQSFGVDCIHIHHLAGVPKPVITWIQKSKLPYIITFHDYYLINGNPYLANSAGEYAGISASPSDSLYKRIYCHPFSYYNWTAESRELIEGSSCNIFPSQTAQNYYFEAFGRIPNAHVVPHDNAVAIQEHQSYSVISIGALGLEKGADFLERVAQAAAQQTANILSFTIIGSAYRDLSNIDQTGPYEDKDLTEIIRSKRPSCYFFPNRCPETYSYTLSEAIHSGIPIIAPMLGIFEERLQCSKEYFLYSPEIQPDLLAKQIQWFLVSIGAAKIRRPPLMINAFYSGRYLEMIRILSIAGLPLHAAAVFDIMAPPRSQEYLL